MLERLLVYALLISPQANLHAEHQVQAQNQSTHAASSQDNLSQKLFEEANKKAKKNPLLAVHDYQRIIAEGGPFKDDAIEKAGNIYELLINKIDPSLKTMRNALIFYDDVIQNHINSTYLAKAYLQSGILIWQLGSLEDSYLSRLKDTFKRSTVRLLEAYKTGTKEVKSEAAWHLGLEYFHLCYFLSDNALNLPDNASNISERQKMLTEAKHYFEQVAILNPNSSRVERTKNLLEYIAYRIQ